MESGSDASPFIVDYVISGNKTRPFRGRVGERIYHNEFPSRCPTTAPIPSSEPRVAILKSSAHLWTHEYSVRIVVTCNESFNTSIHAIFCGYARVSARTLRNKLSLQCIPYAPVRHEVNGVSSYLRRECVATFIEETRHLFSTAGTLFSPTSRPP